MFTLPELEDAQRLVHQSSPGTQHFAWPRLARRSGAAVRVKQTHHTPPAAFARIKAGAPRIVTVTNNKISTAIRAYWTDTHNQVEATWGQPCCNTVLGWPESGPVRSSAAAISIWHYSLIG